MNAVKNFKAVIKLQCDVTPKNFLWLSKLVQVSPRQFQLLNF